MPSPLLTCRVLTRKSLEQVYIPGYHWVTSKLEVALENRTDRLVYKFLLIA